MSCLCLLRFKHLAQFLWKKNSLYIDLFQKELKVAYEDTPDAWRETKLDIREKGQAKKKTWVTGEEVVTKGECQEVLT